MTPQRRFSVELSQHENPKFNVVVAFEDETASSPAMRTYDYVVKQLGVDISVRRTVINVRETGSDRHSAARSAAGADMVILAADEGRELSPEMQAWLNDWSSHRLADEGALVAVLKRSDQEPKQCRLREKLRQVADTARMDFFSSEVTQ